MYIDDILILTKGYLIYHVENLELTLKKLKGSGRKFDIQKSFFGKAQIGYLGFWLRHYGIKILIKK